MANRKTWRCFVLYSLYAVICAILLAEGTKTEEERLIAEKKRQSKRIYTLLNHIIRSLVFVFLSAVFAGLTLGVMCADTLTLEIIADSGPAPDCNYAAKVLPLRRSGHKTLCTLIVSNMLLNVLIAEEFNTMTDLIYDIRLYHVQDPNLMSSKNTYAVWSFICSSLFILIFAEVIPMAICRSKHSLKVASAGAVFVYVAMFITYPISASLGKFLDWIVGSEERGQIYDRQELKKLMRVHTEREGEQGNLAKTELDLLIAALDFHERLVKDIMTPISDVTFVNEDEQIVPDFVEKIWLSGRSRIPVRSPNGRFTDILVVKDLMTVSSRGEKDFQPMTVAQLVKSANRLFAMVDGNTTLPAMLKFFQEAKIHMAVVFSDESVTSATEMEASSRKSFHFRHVESANVIGIVTMEDVVEELLNAEIYDEYDRYDPADRQPSKGSQCLARTPADLVIPKEPKKIPRVNFYSYFTHPEQNTPLSDAQVWAVVYFLNRTVPSFINWSPPYIKLLLDDVKDEQLVVPETPRSTSEEEKKSPNAKSLSEFSTGFPMVSFRPPHMSGVDHAHFLQQAKEERFVLYTKGQQTDVFTLTLGGCVDMLVGNDGFPTRLQSFNSVGEEALTADFYIPEYSAVVLKAARVYRIPKSKYDQYLSYQSVIHHRASNIRVLGRKAPLKRRSERPPRREERCYPNDDFRTEERGGGYGTF